MQKRFRLFLLGAFVVMVTLMTGADGGCSLGESSDCLIFCS